MTEVHGTFAPGYEHLGDLIASAGDDIGKGGIAFSAVVDGTTVADVWAGQARPGVPWAEDTTSSLFSATKGMTAICCMLLHDRGLLDVDAPVSEYWRDFATPVTVRQLLSHVTGLIEVPGYAEFMDLKGNGWDNHAEIRRRLAGATPAWEPGTAQGYHGMTYGYLAGTLVELIDGRPLRQFFSEEIAVPQGLDLSFGPKPGAESRNSVLHDPAPLADEVQAVLEMAILGPGRDPEAFAGRAFLAQDGAGVLDVLAELNNDGRALMCGGGFGDGVGTARGLAQLYAKLNGGWPSPESVATFSAAQTKGPDLILAGTSVYALGFQVNTELPTGVMAFGPGPRTYGHGGAGGQLGCADPDAGMSFGFVRSHLALASPLSRDLVNAVYDATP